MFDDAYNDGLKGRNYTGGDFSDYQRGKGRGGQNSGDDGGIGCFFATAFIAAIFFIVPLFISAISALIPTLLIITYLRIKKEKFSFWELMRANFFASFGYIIFSCIALYFVARHEHLKPAINGWEEFVPVIFYLQFLAIPFAAYIFKIRIEERPPYFVSLLVSLILIVPSIWATSSIFDIIAMKYYPKEMKHIVDIIADFIGRK